MVDLVVKRKLLSKFTILLAERVILALLLMMHLHINHLPKVRTCMEALHTNKTNLVDLVVIRAIAEAMDNNNKGRALKETKSLAEDSNIKIHMTGSHPLGKGTNNKSQLTVDMVNKINLPLVIELNQVKTQAQQLISHQ
jgi:hypothetical protein